MKEKIKNSKIIGLIIFGGIYVITYILSFLIAAAVENLILKMFVFDLAATVIIWAVSLVLRNSSLYDPYWSLTPMVMVIYAVIEYFGGLSVYHFIFLAVFFFWSIRLTANWVVTFENIRWEDWRYRKYRELPAILWHLSNFFGIMMIPTLFVFAGTVPIFILLSSPTSAFSLFGTAVILLGVLLELFADLQMHRFLRSTAEKKTCRVGLWRYSRHPNYLGEILIWLGAYVSLVFTVPSYWYLFGGVAVMIFLFNVISIPLAEKRQLSRRADYAEYRKCTSRLLLLPVRKKRL